MKVRKKRLVFVGDPHVNSIWGTARPGFKAGETVVPSTPFREWSWPCWMDFSERANRERITHIIWNGDLTDGFNEKTAGIGSWSSYKEDWKNAFYDMRKELVRDGKPIEIVTMGTAAHSGIYRGVDIEAEIADYLNCLYCRKAEIEINGIYFVSQHQAGSVSLIRPETTLQREYDQMCKAVATKGRTKPDVSILNHTHIYRQMGWPDFVAIINGSWQSITDYQARKSAYVEPDIGSLIVDVEYDEFRIFFKAYKMPQSIVSSLNVEEIKRILEKREREKESMIGSKPLYPVSSPIPLKKERGSALVQEANQVPLKGKREVLPRK